MSISKLKRQARLNARAKGIRLSVALDGIAQSEGFQTWGHLMASRPKRLSSVARQAAIAIPIAIVMGSTANAEDCAENQVVFQNDLIVGGEVCIPSNPQRVAFSGMGNAALPLGVTEHIGYDGYMQMFMDIYPGLADEPFMEDVPYVGFLFRDDIEALAATAPDLIVSESYWPELNEKLAEIAPTVVVDSAGMDPSETWRHKQEILAALLGLEAKNERLFRELEERIARVRDRLGDDPPTFAVIQTIDEANIIKVHTSGGFGVSIMEATGLVRGPNILSEEEAVALQGRPWDYDISIERLEDVSADYIFVLPSYEGEVSRVNTESPLWQSSQALTQNNVIYLERTPRYFIGEDLPNAHIVLDLIYEHVLDLDPNEIDPNPFGDWLGDAEF